MKVLNEAQDEQIKEIVAYLRQAREEKSLRIEEIAAITRIRLSILQALEEGRFEELPEPIYVQGFIRRFGDAVGLDGSALAQTVATTFSETEPKQENKDLDQKPNLYIPLAVPYILLLAAASFGLFYLLNLQRTAESHSQSQPALNTKKPKTAPKPVASPLSASHPSPTLPKQNQPTLLAKKPKTAATPIASPLSYSTPTPLPTTQANSNVEIGIDLKDQSWVRVKVDGKTEFEGILKKGEHRTWTAKKELTIRSGNAGAVFLSTNKQEPKQLGDKDQVKQVTFTPETVKSQ